MSGAVVRGVGALGGVVAWKVASGLDMAVLGRRCATSLRVRCAVADPAGVLWGLGGAVVWKCWEVLRWWAVGFRAWVLC